MSEAEPKPKTKTGKSERKQPKKAAKRRAQPINRLWIGSMSLLQLALCGLLLLAVNYLSLHHFERKDLSRDQDYSLSSATRNYLKGEELSTREKPVQMIMAYRRSSPFYERVRALAEEYERVAKGRLKLTLVDPLRDPDRMEEIRAAYGINLKADLVLIDARSDETPVTIEQEDHTKILNPHIKIVPAIDMVTHEIINNERKITGFQGEDMLTARLMESIEGQPRRIALIADKSRIGRRESSSERKTLEDLLRFQNISLGEIQIHGLDAIPEDIEGLLVVSPRYDFSEQEIAVLEAYWNRPRAALLVLIGEHPVPPRFRAFLRKQGVTPRDDRLIGRGEKGWVTSARATFTDGIPFTAELAHQITEFGGASSSLEVREGAEDLLNRRINPMTVLQVVPGFWGETEFGKGEAAYDERIDHGQPLQLAACITRGAETDDRFAADSSRMVIIGNTDFLQPAHHRAENLDFLASAANWLVGRDSHTGITPRAISTYKLPLMQAQISFINRINLIFLPFALLLLGGFAWSMRRQ